MNWTSGTLQGAGRTIIGPAATLNIANSSVLSLTSRTLENAGTTTWTGPAGIDLTGAVITNRAGALFDCQIASTFAYVGSAACRFDNAGTLRKSVNTGTTTFLSLVALNNYNTLQLRSGILAAAGGYTDTSASLLDCTLGGTTAGTGFGQLQASGAVALKGALSVEFTNNFVPATSNSFTVLTAGSASGTFANFTYPSNLVTMQLSNAPASVILRVTGVITPPPPLLLQAALSGTNLLLSWNSASNTTYRVQYKSNLTLTNWNALPGDVTAVANTASKLDALTPSNRFYRLLVLP
jgi:hypothetical protein